MNALLIIVLGTYLLPMRPIPVAGEPRPQQSSQSQESDASQAQPQSDSNKPQQQQPEAPAQPASTPAQEPEQSTPAKPEAGATPESCNKASAPVKTGAKSPSRHRRRKKVSSPGSEPEKIVVREGGASEPANQLAPGMPNDQAKRSRQSTDQLLSASQENLKRAFTRTLSSSEQATAEQIKVFIEQANAALKAGDLRRGHNLATKAHALSEALLKP
jgi:hypothetical protein